MVDALVSSESRTSGRGGPVDITADEVELDGGGREFTGITSEALSLGDAGDVTIEARKALTLRNQGFISSGSFSEANAGNVSIRAGSAQSDTVGMKVPQRRGVTQAHFAPADTGNVT